MAKPAQKLFYKIGEVARISNLEPHVLRYWETEFSALKPAKNRAGQRIYRKKDVELIETIKFLLYEKGYTIAGANQQLSQQGYGGQEGIPLFQGAMDAGQRTALGEIRKDLDEIDQLVDQLGR